MVTPFVVLGVLLLSFPLMVALLIRLAVVIVTVESTSMAPTLNHGDRVLALRYKSPRWLRTGRIVVVAPWRRPSGFGEGPGEKAFTSYIKRIVGMPGDTLVTSIDDVLEFMRPSVLSLHDREGKRVWSIPPGHIFVRGDYPEGGFDSLTWGPIPFESVVAIFLLKLPRRDSTIDPLNSTAERVTQPDGPRPGVDP